MADPTSSPEESSSSSPFEQMLKAKKKGLTPTTTKLTLPDGAVHFLRQQGSADCTNSSPETSADAAAAKSCGFVVDLKPDLTIGCVLDDWLFISSQDVANDLSLILQHKITHVLSLLPDFKLVPEVQAVIVEHLCLDYFDEVNFSITDTSTATSALDFIQKVKTVTTSQAQKTNAKVLVHCNAGISRSPSIVILYLMRYEHFSFDEAFKMVKSVRPNAKPNAGFLTQLKTYNNRKDE